MNINDILKTLGQGYKLYQEFKGDKKKKTEDKKATAVSEKMGEAAVIKAKSDADRQAALTRMEEEEKRNNPLAGRTVATPFGTMKLKKGGKVSKKTKGKSKPRGVGAATRGYGKAMMGGGRVKGKY